MTVRLRPVVLVLGVLSLAASAVAVRSQSSPSSTPVVATSPAARVVGPGRVEPASEEIAIGVEVSGRVARVLVEEGAGVTAGAVLAELDNRDYRAALTAAIARRDEARAALQRIRNGARADERREVAAAAAQADAVFAQADVEATRRAGLAAEGVIAREESDRAARDRDVARARRDEVRARMTLVHDGPRQEDHAQAEAALALADAAVQEAEARLAKTVIRSPIAGVVLRRDVRAGETVSAERPTSPLFTVADISRLRVRVEVDEADVARLAVGATASVSASAYGDRRFAARVIRVGRALGRKRLFTSEPRERIDTKVLETLLELEDGATLPVGLRVDAAIDTGR